MFDFESLGEIDYSDLMVTQVTPRFLAIDANDLVSTSRHELEKLSPEESIILYLLASSSAQFTFQGIRRRAGLHQQKISRSLTRLIHRGLIETNSEGAHYITPLGRTLVEPLLNELNRVNDYSQIGLLEHRQKLPYSQSIFPFLRSSLVGKWFDRYRFVSQSHTSLEFISDDRTIHLAIKIDSTSNHLLVIAYAPSFIMAEEAVASLIYKIKILIEKTEKNKKSFAIDSEIMAA